MKTTTVVFSVIGGLLLIAVVMAVLTWRYWKATKPVRPSYVDRSPDAVLGAASTPEERATPRTPTPRAAAPAASPAALPVAAPAPASTPAPAPTSAPPVAPRPGLGPRPGSSVFDD